MDLHIYILLTNWMKLYFREESTFRWDVYDDFGIVPLYSLGDFLYLGSIVVVWLAGLHVI